MEAIVERDNLRKALAQVRRNKGAPGIDGMTVEDLPLYLKDHWPSIRSQLLDGTYRPEPVLRVEIPKAGGGVRALGIPTALDRFIQQAMLQVLQAAWDPTFLDASYGFRPGRSAHQAVARAQEHIADGYGWVVDLDLEKFFDRVNHDILMGLPPGPPGLRWPNGSPTAGVPMAARCHGVAGVSSGLSVVSSLRACWSMDWSDRRTRGPRKVVRCRPCCRI
jgi:hypothetical protein